MALDDSLAAAGDLLLGACCPGCGRPGAGCCADCLAALAEPVRRVRRPLPLPPTFAAGSHAGPRRELVVACKDRQAWTLVGVLGDELARAVAAAVMVADLPAVTLVPVPSAARAVRERGLDVTARLAERAARRLRSLGVATTSAAVLRQQHDARDQVGLGAAERLANLTARLECRRPVAGPVVVVDDIVTTGASLLAACTAVRGRRTDVVGCATVSARGWS